MKTEVKTYGCALNQADSEMIYGLLEKHGLMDAGVVVVNTCTVKAPTENKILKELRRLKGEGKKVVVAGCLPAARPSIVGEFPGFSFIGVNVRDVVDAVSAASAGKRYVNISEGKGKSGLPQVRTNPVVAIIPIAEGCLGSCNYCQVRFARGKLRSYGVREIVKQVEFSVKNGAKEVWLTAQDTGAYGRDFGGDLPGLLNAVADIPLDFKVRVGMMNPNHVVEFLDELLAAYESGRIYKFVHVPVQSGDPKVLEDMNRKYGVGDFKTIVSKFRSRFNATISTDVIVGYPTEGGEAFQKTLRLIGDIEPDVLNISRYWTRPGTQASKLKQLSGSETNRRSRITAELFNKVGLERSKGWIGWEGEALVSEKNEDGTYTARNMWYKPVVVKSREDLLGRTVKVKVDSCTYFDLRGRVLQYR